MTKIPVEISARHAHLSPKDLEALFGAGYELKKIKQLGQPSDFAAQETIIIKSHTNILENVRVIGPVRGETQVEISKTDAIFLHIDAPVRLSGDIAGTPGIVLVGPAGEVEVTQGVIAAQRHLHCTPQDAKKFGLKNGQKISVEINSNRPVIFKDVAVRMRDDYMLCLHLDTDEGNAAGINKTAVGILVKD